MSEEVRVTNVDWKKLLDLVRRKKLNFKQLSELLGEDPSYLSSCRYADSIPKQDFDLLLDCLHVDEESYGEYLRREEDAAVETEEDAPAEVQDAPAETEDAPAKTASVQSAEEPAAADAPASKPSDGMKEKTDAALAAVLEDVREIRSILSDFAQQYGA